MNEKKTPTRYTQLDRASHHAAKASELDELFDETPKPEQTTDDPDVPTSPLAERAGQTENDNVKETTETTPKSQTNKKREGDQTDQPPAENGTEHTTVPADAQESAEPAPTNAQDPTKHPEPAQDIPLQRFASIPIEYVGEAVHQPRKNMDEEAFNELKQSIQENGLIQPILVSEDGTGHFTLIAGQRRLLACKALGHTEISAIINPERDRRDEALISIVENIQREDIDKLEESAQYHILAKQYKMSKRDIARYTGKDRSYISRIMQLNDMPEAVTNLYREGKTRDVIALNELNAMHHEDPQTFEVIAAENEISRHLIAQAKQGNYKPQQTRATARPPEPDLDLETIEAIAIEAAQYALKNRDKTEAETNSTRLYKSIVRKIDDPDLHWLALSAAQRKMKKRIKELIHQNRAEESAKQG